MWGRTNKRKESKLLIQKQSDANTAWKNISQVSIMPRGALSSNDQWYNLLLLGMYKLNLQQIGSCMTSQGFAVVPCSTIL